MNTAVQASNRFSGKIDSVSSGRHSIKKEKKWALLELSQAFFPSVVKTGYNESQQNKKDENFRHCAPLCFGLWSTFAPFTRIGCICPLGTLASGLLTTVPLKAAVSSTFGKVSQVVHEESSLALAVGEAFSNVVLDHGTDVFGWALLLKKEKVLKL